VMASLWRALTFAPHCRLAWTIRLHPPHCLAIQPPCLRLSRRKAGGHGWLILCHSATVIRACKRPWGSCNGPWTQKSKT